MMLRKEIIKKFSKDWDIVEKDEDMFLVSKEDKNNLRRVISVFNENTNLVSIKILDVKHLLDQDEETIDFMLEYSFPKEDIKNVKKEMRKNRDNYTRNDVLLYCDLHDHGYGQFVGSETFNFCTKDIGKWSYEEFASKNLSFLNKVLETLEFYANF